MRVKIAADKLRPLVETAAGLAPGTGKRPQLECSRLMVSTDGELTVAASNTHESVCLKVAIEEGDPGSVFLPSVNLQRIVKEVIKVARLKKDEGFLEIRWNGKNLKADLLWRGAKAQLPTEPIDSLPAFEPFDESTGFVTLPAKLFTGLFKRMTFAVQTDFTKRAMHGVQIRASNGKLVSAATDGMRFSLLQADIAKSEHVIDAIIPPIGNKTLLRLSADGDQVDLQITDSTLRARGKLGEMSWTRVAGDFPDWEGHVPTTQPKNMDLDRKTMIAMLKQAGLLKVVGSTTHRFTLENNRMEMAAVSGVEGSVNAHMDIPWPHPKLEIGLDPKFLEEGLAAMDSAEVWVGFDHSQAHAVFREKTDEFSYIYVVVPRLSS
jgi:DNA polymerase-3 subunit beta